MNQQIRYLLYLWKKEYREMCKWHRFNSGVDAVRALGELTRLRKDIEQLEETIGNPKGNDWVDSGY